VFFSVTRRNAKVRFWLGTAITACCLLLPHKTTFAQDSRVPSPLETSPAFAEPTKTGFLPLNGWHLTPAGESIETSDMLLNIIPLRDNRHALAATDGYNEHQLVLVDLQTTKPTRH